MGEVCIYKCALIRNRAWCALFTKRNKCALIREQRHTEDMPEGSIFEGVNYYLAEGNLKDLNEVATVGIRWLGKYQYFRIHSTLVYQSSACIIFNFSLPPSLPGEAAAPRGWGSSERVLPR